MKLIEALLKEKMNVWERALKGAELGSTDIDAGKLATYLSDAVNIIKGFSNSHVVMAPLVMPEDTKEPKPKGFFK
mgnify:CR=1 FL=1